MKLYYLADFFVEDIPGGGAELSDSAIMDYLDKDFTKIKSQEVESIDEDGFYVVGNRSLLPHQHYAPLCRLGNYIIIEHDFQFLEHRNPYVYEDGVAPDGDVKVLYKNFYARAKAVFFQTSFQQSLFEKNKIDGNFINLGTTPYSPADFKLFTDIITDPPLTINKAFAIVESSNEIKNTQGALEFCKGNNFNFGLVPSGQTRESFLRCLMQYATLVFFPTRPESCSRLATEARVLGLNVITTPTYGAPLEPWFKLTKRALISELKTIIEKGIKNISDQLP